MLTVPDTRLGGGRLSIRCSIDVTAINCDCDHADCKVIADRLRSKNFRCDLGVPSKEEREVGIRSSKSIESQVYAGDIQARPQSQPVKRVFFSPHPDDVAYSCYGLVSMSAKQAAMMEDPDDVSATGSASSAGAASDATSGTESSMLGLNLSSDPLFERSEAKEKASSKADPVDWQQSVIVTVFSKSRCANGAIGARLRHCVKETTAMRQREDEAFAKSVGAKLISLGLSDTSARDEGSRHPELLAAASSRTTASRLTVDHPMFDVVKERVKPIVQWAISNHATIHIPLAVGCHIDHWMVRVAVLSSLVDIEHDVQWSQLRNARRQTRMSGIDPMHILALAEQGQRMQGSHLIFYEDLPYGFIGTDDMVQQTVAHFLPRNARVQLVPMTDADWQRKMEAVRSYESQMKTTLLNMLHDHASMLAKQGVRIDDQWHDAPKQWTMAERSWVLEEVCGPTANLLASISALSSVEERPLNRRESKALQQQQQQRQQQGPPSIRNSPAFALKSLPITFTSPFDVSAATEPLSRLTVKQDEAVAISPLMRPDGRLRRMSTCPSSGLAALAREHAAAAASSPRCNP